MTTEDFIELPAEKTETALDLRAVRSFGREIAVNIVSHPGDFAILIVGLLLESSFTAAVPISFRFLADHVIAERDKGALVLLILGLSIGVVVVSSIGFLRDYKFAEFMSRLLNGLRRKMFVHLTRLSMDYFSRAKVADILARFSTDLASVESALTAAIAWGVIPALDVIISFGLLIYLDWRLAIVAALVFPVSLLGPRIVLPKATAATHRRKADESLALGNVQESVAAQSVVKAFGLDRLIKQRFEERLAGLNRSSVRMTFLGCVLERSSGLGTLVLQVVVLGIGGLMVFSNQISIGTLAAFQTVFLTLSWSLGYVSQYFPYILGASAGMRRIDELLDVREGVADAPNAVDLSRLEQEIVFKDVSFGYTAEHPVLNGASFTIRRGESTAFVGASGSGKSTVLNLLLRFYDAGSGSITLDGRELRAVTQASLRSQMAVVFQDANRPARRLSGGEQQRLALARRSHVILPSSFSMSRQQALTPPRPKRSKTSFALSLQAASRSSCPRTISAKHAASPAKLSCCIAGA
jgi:ATP-binding cassette subfamily B protein